MNNNISLCIQCGAYIPNRLGKHLLEYFPNYRDLKNAEDFKTKLDEISKDKRWIKDPLGDYTTTDNVDDSSCNGNESIRTHRLLLKFGLKNLSNIGSYGIKDIINPHPSHNDKIICSFQHSDISTRIFVDPSGVIGELETKRSKEDAKISYPKITNSNGNTTIEIKASAGYPFLEYYKNDNDFEKIRSAIQNHFVPNIDFKLKFVFKKNNNGDIDLCVKIIHNSFPSYYLKIDKDNYNHVPSIYNYLAQDSGPSPINLTRSVNPRIFKFLISKNTLKLRILHD